MPKQEIAPQAQGTMPPTTVSSSSVVLAKVLFFLAAGLSLLMSVYLFFSGHREQGIFVGLWVPSILSAANLLLKGGNYN